MANREIDADWKRRLRVIVAYKKRWRGSLGYGWYDIPRIKLLLPKDGSVDTVLLAHTIAHELAHTKHRKHRDINNTVRYGYKDGWREHYAWAAEHQI